MGRKVKGRWGSSDIWKMKKENRRKGRKEDIKEEKIKRGHKREKERKLELEKGGVKNRRDKE